MSQRKHRCKPEWNDQSKEEKVIVLAARAN
jgi:hypothetical protein